MAVYAIAPCAITDSADLSRNNISAFREDSTWVLAWRHVTLEQHIAITAKRYPRRLISDCTVSRHQKAIDPKTGRLLGYARWILPAPYATNADGGPAWPEAVPPMVGPDEEAEIHRVAKATPWNPNHESDPLDIAIGKVKDELMARKPYLCLDYLAVHPENQGKGIATGLVQSGIEQATKMGLDIFVMAFEPAFGLYSRLGFRVEKELIQDASIYGGEPEYAVRYMVYEQDGKPESMSRGAVEC